MVVAAKEDKMKPKSQMGMTMTELMVSVAIFLMVLGGVLISYLTCLELAEVSKNSSIAIKAVKSRMEAVRNTSFAQIKATYHNSTFTTAGLPGIGVTYVDDTVSDLIHVTTVFCWRQPRGRVIGEDTDLDGVLDSGEDKNGNGRLDSLVETEMLIYDE